MKIKKLLLLSILSLSLVSCANTDEVKTANIETNDVVVTTEKNFMADEYDPWEPFNKRMYYFNYQIERLVITPIVNTYKFSTKSGVINL